MLLIYFEILKIMIKKILLVFLILSVLYGISIFLLPEVSAKIDTVLWIPGFSENIRWKKDFFDGSVTSSPKVEEFKETYSTAVSWAIDGVNTTKEKIDTIRTGAQQIQETYEESKQTFDDAKQVFDDASTKIEEIQWIVDNVKQLTGSWSN